MRMEHLEGKRKQKYKMIKDERDAVIHEIEHGISGPYASVSAGNSTGSGGKIILLLFWPRPQASFLEYERSSNGKECYARQNAKLNACKLLVII